MGITETNATLREFRESALAHRLPEECVRCISGFVIRSEIDTDITSGQAQQLGRFVQEHCLPRGGQIRSRCSAPDTFICGIETNCPDGQLVRMRAQPDATFERVLAADPGF